MGSFGLHGVVLEVDWFLLLLLLPTFPVRCILSFLFSFVIATGVQQRHKELPGTSGWASGCTMVGVDRNVCWGSMDPTLQNHRWHPSPAIATSQVYGGQGTRSRSSCIRRLYGCRYRGSYRTGLLKVRSVQGWVASTLLQSHGESPIPRTLLPWW